MKSKRTSRPLSTNIVKNSNNWLTLFFSIFAFLLLVSTIYLYFENQLFKNKLATYQDKPASQSLPISTKVVNPVTGWNVYTNTKYGYSIEYPPDWIVKLGVAEGPGDDSKLETVYQVRFSPNLQENNSVIVWARVGKTYFEDLNDFSSNLGRAKPNSESIEIYKNEKVLLDGVEAIRYKHSKLGEGKVITVSTIKNGYQYSVDLDPATELKNIKVFDQILSTFKFNDPQE